MGILKAEGVYEREISHAFVGYLMVILTIGSIFGLMLGYGASKLLQSLFMNFYSIPLEKFTADPIYTTLFVIGIIFVFEIILVYIIGIRHNVKKNTLLLIKNVSFEKPPHFKLTFLMSKFSFITRYKIKVLLKSMWQIIVLIMATLVSSFLLLFVSLFISTLYEIQSGTYSDIYTYDYQVFSTTSTEHNFTEDANGIINFDIDINEIKSNKEVEINPDIKYSLYGYQGNNEYINHILMNGDEVGDIDQYEGVLVSSMLYYEFNLKKGDVIVIENPVHKDQEVELEVVGFIDDPTTPRLYGSAKYYQEKLDLQDDYYNGFVTSTMTEDEIVEEDKNAAVVSSEQLASALDGSLGLILSMVTLIGTVSVIITGTTLITISSIIVKNNSKMISILRVLGYTTKEIRRVTTSSYKWVITIVYFATIPLIEWLINAFFEQILADMDMIFHVNIDLKWSLFGYAIIMGVYLFSTKLTEKNIDQVSLAESLKADE